MGADDRMLRRPARPHVKGGCICARCMQAEDPSSAFRAREQRATTRDVDQQRVDDHDGVDWFDTYETERPW